MTQADLAQNARNFAWRRFGSNKGAMDWTKPIPTDITSATPPFQRIVTMLGHFDFRYYLTQTAYVDVGAGSLPAVNNLALSRRDIVGCLGTIGRYTEVAEDARITIDAEHANDRAANVVFAGAPLVRAVYRDGLTAFKPFSLGNNVILSSGVCVLPGRTIGDGCVVGAGAVVTKDLEPFGIYAGVPAKMIKERRRRFPWWDLDSAFLFSHLNELDGFSGDGLPQRGDQPRFAVRLNGRSLDFLGVVTDRGISPISAMSGKVAEYVTQALTTDRPYWLADLRD